MNEKTLDVICLGRAGVDLYGEQIGSRLEDMQSFAKYVGGSSCNISIGSARQGLKSAMLTRVGDEHMGRFIRETLQAEGVDVSHVVTDPERLTALVILGIKDRDTFPLIFYRENCADMAVSKEDFDKEFVASSRALLITGTHFSTEGTDAASRQAIAYANEAGTKTVLDIDYRPVLWGLTGHGLGEERFVAAERVTAHLQSIVPLFDLIVGTEEEIHIAGGSTDTVTALRALRRLTGATLVAKRGPLGCSIFPGDIPDSLDEGITVQGVTVEVLNVLGAGDAFMSGFLRGWIQDEPLENCGRYANACGALVVSRHGCAPAMPSRVELDDYLARAENVPRPDLDARLNHLHRVTNRRREWREICALAFDHRIQLEEMADDAGTDLERIPYLKGLIAQALRKAAELENITGRVGVLVDGRFGQAVLEALTGTGVWIGRPVELPGVRPLQFEPGDNVGLAIRAWPDEHVVKCLVFYHPDDNAETLAIHDRKIRELYEACVATDHDLLLEIIPPSGMFQDETTVARALERIYGLGVFPDWWKLRPPSRGEWPHINRVIANNDPHCRGVVLLGLDAPEEVLKQGFDDAADQPLCKGFAVGRSIFSAPSRQWLAGEIDDQALIDTVAENYRAIIDLWRKRKVPASHSVSVNAN